MALRFYNTLTQTVGALRPAARQRRADVHLRAHRLQLRPHRQPADLTFPDILRRWLAARGYRARSRDEYHRHRRQDHPQRRGRATSPSTNTRRSVHQGVSRRHRDAAPGAARTHRQSHRAHRTTWSRPSRISTERGYTYVSDGSVYYRIAKFPEYGKLSHNDFSGIRAGARVDVDEYDKADARDFVLWKAKKEGEPAWHTPIGEGPPRLAHRVFRDGDEVSGRDARTSTPAASISPSRITKTKSRSRRRSPANRSSRFWLHAEHLSIDAQKMSKSLGNFYTLRDLKERGYAPEAFATCWLPCPYRKKLNFTFDGLKAAATSIDRLRNYKLRLETDKFPEGTNAALGRADPGRTRCFRRGARRRSQHRRSAGRRLRICSRHQHRHGRGRVSGRQCHRQRSNSCGASTRSSTC